MAKKRWLSIVLWIGVVALVGTGTFFLGRQTVDQAVQAEKTLNIQLNRSELDGLGTIEGPIYVTGHKSPDSDSVGCAIGYAALLRQLGFDAKPVVLSRINNETQYVLKTAGLEFPELMEDASGCNMVLVDHSEYSQSADGLQDAHIISILDHHGAGSVTTANTLIYDARPLGSCATIVWMRYRNYGLAVDKQSAFAMMGSILSDTKNLQSQNTTFADREALKALSAIAGVKDTDAFYKEMYKAAVSYEGMTDEEIYFNDYKEYEKGGTKFSIGCINAYDEASAKDLAERMKAVFPDAIAKTGMDLAFVQIDILHDDLSATYLLPGDEKADEVLQIALEGKATFDGLLYKHEPYASRKKLSVPEISAVLEAHPKE